MFTFMWKTAVVAVAVAVTVVSVHEIICESNVKRREKREEADAKKKEERK